MNILKQYLPPWLKLNLRLMLRHLQDISNGNYFRYAKKRKVTVDSKHQIRLVQVIKKTPKWENKVKNIALGAQRIATFLIYPHEIFSFWNAASAPYPSQGYLLSRNLQKGKLVDDYGGGLCQLSGMLYHLALIAGLKIIERHNHSVDIYTEEERFTPLGADATVVYGYKDLKFLNPYSFPIYFRFEINSESLECCLLSEEKIHATEVRFETAALFPLKEIRTKVQVEKDWETIAISRYKYLDA